MLLLFFFFDAQKRLQSSVSIFVSISIYCRTIQSHFILSYKTLVIGCGTDCKLSLFNKPVSESQIQHKKLFLYSSEGNFNMILFQPEMLPPEKPSER